MCHELSSKFLDTVWWRCEKSAECSDGKVVGAYRYIDMDYESDDGGRDFRYDMSMSGPALGVVFTF